MKSNLRQLAPLTAGIPDGGHSLANHSGRAKLKIVPLGLRRPGC
ncbi:MAG: hypothetical protein ACO1RT_01695 [Planctomycetaceae bacterium]